MTRKRKAAVFLSIFFICILSFFSQIAREGAATGIELCLKTVIPALFPFFFLSNIIISNLIGTKNRLLQIMGKLFSIPEGYEGILIPAFLGGYPTGAAAVCNLFRSGTLQKEEAESLLSFCNNAGPSFIFGMIAPLFCERYMVWIIYGAQILGAYIASHYFSMPAKHNQQASHECTQTLSEVMAYSMRSMALVCGWIILFKILFPFCSPLLEFSHSNELSVLLYGLLELTNGCCMLSSISDSVTRAVIASFLLASGGLCVSMQTISLMGRLSPKKYICGKIIQSVSSAVLTYIVCAKKWYLLIGSGIVCFFLTLKRVKKCSNPDAVGV